MVVGAHVPYLGWMILGWVLMSAAVELNMVQRLLDTVSLTAPDGSSSSHSPSAPAFNAIDEAIQLRRLNAPQDAPTQFAESP